MVDLVNMKQLPAWLATFGSLNAASMHSVTETTNELAASTRLASPVHTQGTSTADMLNQGPERPSNAPSFPYVDGGNGSASPMQKRKFKDREEQHASTPVKKSRLQDSGNFVRRSLLPLCTHMLTITQVFSTQVLSDSSRTEAFLRCLNSAIDHSTTSEMRSSPSELSQSLNDPYNLEGQAGWLGSGPVSEVLPSEEASVLEFELWTNNEEY